MKKLICNDNHCYINVLNTEMNVASKIYNKRAQIMSDIKNFMPDEMKQEIKQEKKKQGNNVRRAINNILKIITDNVSGDMVFMTLTYAENETDTKKCNNDFMKFIQRIKYHSDVDFKYLCIKEYQKRGAIHYHLIIFNYDKNYLNWVFDKEQVIQPLWPFGFGHIKYIFDLTSLDSIASYMGKYLSKLTQRNDKDINKKMYFTSKNLKRDRVVEIIIDEYLDLVDNYAHENITYNVGGLSYTKIIFDKSVFYKVLPF